MCVFSISNVAEINDKKKHKSTGFARNVEKPSIVWKLLFLCLVRLPY